MDVFRAGRTRPRSSLLTLLVSVVALSGLAGCHGEQPTAWSTSLLARTDKLFDVTHVRDDTFVAVGYNGRILRSETAGASWVDIEPPTTWSLNQVDFVGDRGWAVGHNGAVIHSRDGGKTWATQQAETTKTLMAVSFVDENYGWACGDESTWMWTDNGGETWNVERMDVSQVGLSEFSSLAVPDIIYYSVQFLDRMNGWMVGEYGNVRVTNDGGKTWGAQHGSLLDELVARGGANDVMTLAAFFSVHFTDPMNGVLVGGGGAIATTTNGGEQWSWVAREGDNTWVEGTEYDIPALHMYDIGDPGDNGQIVTVGMNAAALGTGNGGRNWGPVATPDGVYTWINGIAFNESGKGVLVGGKGTIMTSGDGGASWTLIQQDVAEPEEDAAH